SYSSSISSSNGRRNFINPPGLSAMDLIIFFFQAEDGIRYGHVTGVQTCALPISIQSYDANVRARAKQASRAADERALGFSLPARSEERRVGKESSIRCPG